VVGAPTDQFTAIREKVNSYSTILDSLQGQTFLSTGFPLLHCRPRANGLKAILMRPNSSTRNLQRRLRRYFPLNSLLRGETYFYRDAVMAIRVGTTGATAEVLGSTSYTVSLDWSAVSKERMRAHCTCPHFTEGSLCKHLWAFVLKLDAIGAPPRQIAQAKYELTLGKQLELDGTVEALASTVRSAKEASASAPKASAISRSTWREILNRPDVPKETARSNEDIYMVIEPLDREDAAIQFRFYRASRGVDGAWGELRPYDLAQSGTIRHTDVNLQFAFKTLNTLALGERARGNAYFGYRFQSDASMRTLDLDSVRAILPLLLATRRVFVSKEDCFKSLDFIEDLSLKPAEFGKIHLKVSDLNSEYSLGAWVEVMGPDGMQRLPASELKLVARPNLYRIGTRVGFVDIAPSESSWLEQLARADLHVPSEDSEPLLETILNQALPVELSPSLSWERVMGTPEAKLDLQTDKDTLLGRYVIDLKFEYGARLIPSWSSIREMPSREHRTIFMRNFQEEARIEALLPQSLMAVRRGEDVPSILSKDLNEFVQHALKAGIAVTVENKKIQESSDFQVSVSSGLDWFDVEGQAAFSGQWVQIPAILEAVGRGENFVPLPDGSVGLINEEMSRRLERLAAFSSKNKGSLRFSASQGLMLNALLEDEVNLKADARFGELREKIKGFEGIKPLQPVPSFKGKLRKYQREALGWMEFLDGFGLGGILADDMGLGKTVQCLAFLESRRSKREGVIKPSLLLAPKSVLDNWRLEAGRFTPDVRVLVYAGLKRGGSIELFQQYDLVVTTYQTMLRDIEMLKEVEWDCVIVDEAQAIKNPEAMASKATKLLRAQFRLAMTGTPIENSVQDLFSISDFTNPGFLNGHKRSSQLKLSEETRVTLSKAFKPVVLRRTKGQVLKDLPEKTEQVISVELESKQLKIYNDLKRFYQSQLVKDVREKGVSKMHIQVLAALTRLRQVALHPGLVDPSHVDLKSSKFEVMLEMLAEVISEGNRVLIFSQFTSLLALLKTELTSRGIEFSYLDGQTTDRQEVVNSFRGSDCPVFLMSLKAGGVGLNLVEANYVFLLDPWWNPAVEAQAIDRVHRIGQKRAVNAYRFIAKDTVEEKILELQQVKRGLFQEILGEEPNPIRKLTAQDIETLFS